MPTVKLVNLSSVIAHISINEVIQHFAALLDERDAVQSSICCPSFVKHQLNVLYVQALCWWNTKTLIDPYKLGTITTEQFLDGLFNLFNPQQTNAETAPLTEISRDALQAAWNSMIVWDEKTSERLNQLFENREPGDHVIFVSNTNALHVEKILALIAEHYAPSADVKLTINQSTVASPSFFQTVKSANAIDSRLLPFNMIPEAYLATSYRFQRFKTAEDQQEMSSATLMATLIGKSSRDKVLVISHYAKDLAEAKRNGASVTTCLLAKDFFTIDQLRPQKKFN